MEGESIGIRSTLRRTHHPKRIRSARIPGLVTTPERSRLMASVRQTGTSAEISAGRILRKLGIDYVTKVSELPGTPDMANCDERWAIFVHGCFWHAHEGCRRWTIPKRNRRFWKRKFTDNARRDRQKVKRLQALGYSVLVVWECELEDDHTLEERLRRFVLGGREGGNINNQQ